jgi:hypothetical protein
MYSTVCVDVDDDQGEHLYWIAISAFTTVMLAVSLVVRGASLLHGSFARGPHDTTTQPTLEQLRQQLNHARR